MNYVNQNKIKIDVFKCRNKSIFLLIVFFNIFIYIYMKASKDLSAKYCQENKERL